ncbi:MAG: hypothetical protein ABI877_07910 [Gemmatimonadaceae bacterium]
MHRATPMCRKAVQSASTIIKKLRSGPYVAVLSGDFKMHDPNEIDGSDTSEMDGSDTSIEGDDLLDDDLTDGDFLDRKSRRGKVASMLDGVASRLHEKADAGSERVMDLGHGAADKVEATARYVREHDRREMMSDVEAFARKHPGKSLLAVAVVGFLAGRALRNGK